MTQARQTQLGLGSLLISAIATASILALLTLVAIAVWIWLALTGKVLSLTPIFSLWLLVPLFLLALGLTAFLYREQRRMAGFSSVLALTLLRLALIALLAVLFLQPSLRLETRRTTAGTLWVIVDQSPSMQTVDAQSTPAERLHWAEGIGLVQRPLRPDELMAQARVLADELDALIPDPTSGYGGDVQAVIKAAADRADAWVARLKKFSAAVEDARGKLNGYSSGAGDRALDEVNAAVGQAKRNVAAMRSAGSAYDAGKVLQPETIDAFLARASQALAPAAAAADADYLHQNAGRKDWDTANSRLSADTRRDLMDGLLTSADAPASKPLHDLSNQYNLRVGSFSDKTQLANSVSDASLDDALRAAMVPSGQSTNLGGMLQYVAEHTSADEAASVIVVTDGRNNIGGDPTSPARNLAARGVHVYGLLIGSHELSPDAAVEPVDFPDWIFKGDTVKPRALVRLDGLQGQTALVQAYRGGVLLQEQRMPVTQPHQMVPFDFTDQPPETDKVLEYQIKVSPMQGEVNTQNNLSSFRVAVKKDKLYALIIEDRPRWEYRYLAAYLSRRPTMMKLQTVLLQPAMITGIAPPPPVAASPDNPHTEATQLPATLADWEKFDLIVIGDVGPEIITPQIQQYIAAAVRDKGATLIALAGQHAMPAKYAGAVLGELLPITPNPQYSPADIERDTKLGFRPQSAAIAGMSVLAQLGPDAASNGNAWQNMPAWYWHSPYTEAKPAATVSWTIGADDAGAGEDGEPMGHANALAQSSHHALLSSLPVGLGHSLYLASDQTWRLRQVGGLNLHERFWGQVLNWAVGSDLPAGGKYVRFGANQPSYEQTQPVIVTARVLKDDLTPYTGLNFSALARPVHSTATGPAQPAANTVEARFVPMESPGYYQATLSNLPIGDDEITLQGAEVERLLDSDPTVTLRNVVVKIYPTMNAERQNMNTDPVTLEAVARAGGGFSVDGQYAGMLLSRLPKIEHVETTVVQYGFFADPHEWRTHVAHWVFLGLFVLLITLEWGWRKRAGLI